MMNLPAQKTSSTVLLMLLFSNPHLLGAGSLAAAAATATPAQPNRRILTEGHGGYGGKAPHSYGASHYGAHGKSTGCYQGGYG